jgi:glycosyltransferase involved in cell wall biosynthesis
MKILKIFVYPWDINPYQQLLYDALKKRYGARVRVLTHVWRLPFVWPAVLPLILIAARIAGYTIFHMHWTKLAVEHGPKRLRYTLSGYTHRVYIRFITLLGYRIVWTVHNILPHEPQTTDDQAMARFLAAASDACIVHSQYTVREMRQLHMDTSHTVVIPHGNYNDVYPRTRTRSAARSALGITKGETAILFFGKIRAYKGLADLLEAFTRLQHPTARLIIAGQCDDPDIHEVIMAARTQARISYFPGHVRDDQVAQYYMASDIVCLPFKTVTTSGSALLAMTFGKPLVAPRAGALHDLPKNVGVLYDPTRPDALLTSLQRALAPKADITAMGKAAAAYARELSWDAIAVQTHAVYEAVDQKNNAAG